MRRRVLSLATKTILDTMVFFSKRMNQDLYLCRLGLDPNLFYQQPRDYELLCQLTERHVSKIPFENLAQHGGTGGLVKLDLEAIASKVLKRHRGGFCFELNGLFSSFLESLGFTVTRCPAVVNHPETGFDHPSTHMTLIVTCPGDIDSVKYLVDVAFGEPSIHPLLYDFDQSEQITAEGMISRLVHVEDHVILEWRKEGKWLPRLQFNHEAALLTGDKNPQLEDFNKALEFVHGESSPFTGKLIVCKISREEKRTLAGNKLKVTGPPRFGPDTPVIVTTLDSLDQVRHVLEDDFGIPWVETANLDLSKSLGADPSVWAQF